MFSKDNLHHAYFIEGSREAVLSDIEGFLRDAFSMARQGNPDVCYLQCDSFGIDEGRMLQEMQLVKPLAGDRKVFIVAVDAMTVEAQNSLLKVFEEPTAGTHFFLISSSKRILLPTLRSRVTIVSHPTSYESGLAEEARAFLGMSVKDRLNAVADMVEEKDKARAEGFLLALVSELRGPGMEKAGAARAEAIREILSLVGYLKDRAPSVKLILERVALLNLG